MSQSTGASFKKQFTSVSNGFKTLKEIKYVTRVSYRLRAFNDKRQAKSWISDPYWALVPKWKQKETFFC